MSSSSDQTSVPGDEPETRNFKPKLRWHRAELIGFLVLVVLPILAVFGVFGPTLDKSSAANGSLRLEVEHPARMRFHTVEHLLVHVTNTGEAPVAEVNVSFSDAYIRNFSDVKFTPEANQAYLVSLGELAPGDTRLISVQLKADDYGRYGGDVAVMHDGERLAVPIKTLILP